MEIAERESRRGSDLGKVVPETASAVRALKDLRESYWDQVRGLDHADKTRAAAREKYVERRLELRNNRDDALEGALQVALDSFQTELVEGSFIWGLQDGPLINGRPTFRVNESLSVAFPGKEAASILREASGASLVGRNSIVRALKHSLRKRYRHAVYRVDIQKFFASIPHETLLHKVSEVRDLDRITVGLIKQLLKEYELLTGGAIGVPAGVGLSSQLAELYLNGFDRVLRSSPGVLFCARYVDDIILVLESEEARSRIEVEIARLLAELGLRLNDTKEKFASFVSDSDGNYAAGDSIEYLGYEMSRAEGGLLVGLTSRRAERRKDRLQQAFDEWLSKDPTRKTANSGDEGIFNDRVRFLAANTALKNSKANVAIGIYFSNSALELEAQELSDLDELLRSLISANRTRMSPRLQKRLRSISFREAFKERSFVRFKQKRLEQIVQLWKRETL